MKEAISGLLSSKKAIVYIVTVAVMAAVMFGGVDPEHASDFIDSLTDLAMAYLGGQGLADLGRHAGAAYASGKKAIDNRDEDVSGWTDRAAEAGDAAEDAAAAVETVVEKAPIDGPPET